MNSGKRTLRLFQTEAFKEIESVTANNNNKKKKRNVNVATSRTRSIVVLRTDVTRNLHVTDDNYVVTVVYRRQRSITLPRHNLPADPSRLRDYLAVAIRAQKGRIPVERPH